MKALIFIVLLVIFNISLTFARDRECSDCHVYKEVSSNHDYMIEACDSCHAPHGEETGQPHQLWDSIENTCSMCHDEVDKHPIENHPMMGAKDPLHPEKSFSCSSCHNPHGSNQDKLFRYAYDKNTPYKGIMCATCHWKITYGGNAPKTPKWNSNWVYE